MINLDLIDNNETIILYLNKRLTFKESNNIDKYLFPLILKYDVKNVILDFSKIKFINPAGFHILIKLKWIMKIKKGKVCFKEVPEVFREDFKNLKFSVLKDNKRKGVKI